MIIGAMYAAVLYVGIDNCATVQPIVAIERTVFYRERAAGMYSALPYALAQVSEGPYMLTVTKILHKLIIQFTRHYYIIVLCYQIVHLNLTDSNKTIYMACRSLLKYHMCLFKLHIIQR